MTLVLVNQSHVVYPECIAWSSDISTAMRRRELKHEMCRSLIGRSPSYLLDRHALAMAVAGIVGGAQPHERGIIASHVADVTIMDGVGGVVNPSVAALAILHDHSAHSFRRDVALGILVAFLQVEYRHGIVVTSHGGSTAETILLDAGRTVAQEGLIVISHGLWTSRERNAPVDGLRTVLRAR